MSNIKVKQKIKINIFSIFVILQKMEIVKKCNFAFLRNS